MAMGRGEKQLGCDLRSPAWGRFRLARSRARAAAEIDSRVCYRARRSVACDPSHPEHRFGCAPWGRGGGLERPKAQRRYRRASPGQPKSAPARSRWTASPAGSHHTNLEGSRVAQGHGSCVSVVWALAQGSPAGPRGTRVMLGHPPLEGVHTSAPRAEPHQSPPTPPAPPPPSAPAAPPPRPSAAPRTAPHPPHTAPNHTH